MKELLSWFRQNPNREVSTHELGTIGLKYRRRGTMHVYNQSTLERTARELVIEGKLESRHEGGYVRFKLAENAKNREVTFITRADGVRVALI